MIPPLSFLVEFYNKLILHDNDRFRSFEHCFLFFKSLIMKQSVGNKDLAMLHLGFYLASWGMYRGSSFLLQKDYKIYSPVIDILFHKDYNDLWFLEKKLNVTNKEKFSILSLNLHSELQEYFEGERTKYYSYINKKSSKQEISSTLTTKIMMGTLGCLPAFDRYFKSGIKRHNELNKSKLIQSFSSNSILRIYEFFLENKETLLQLQLDIEHKTKVKYPLMKLIDSYFWLIGYKEENNIVL